MSLLIEGMSKKEFAELLGLYKILPPEVIDEMKTLEGHKVIELPPHGRLIDAEKFENMAFGEILEAWKENDNALCQAWDQVLHWLIIAQTIIESEE